MEYDIVRINKSHLANLKLLFTSVYHKNSFDLLGLEDRFATNKFGLDFLGYLAYSKKERSEIPAAYYGVFPILANIDGKTILCAQSGDTMTHKNHRKKGLFTELAKMTYETARKEGVEFIFGFPSPSSYPGFKHKLEWVFPFDMIKFTRLVPTIPLGQIKKYFNMKIGDINFLSKKYLSLINNLNKVDLRFWNNENIEDCVILRNNDYIDYKFSSNKNKFFITNNNTEVFLKYDGNISIGGIYGKQDYASLKKIFRKIDILAFLTGSAQIRSYFSPHSELNIALSKFGKLSKSMPYGFINLSNRYDPTKLKLNFADYDYF